MAKFHVSAVTNLIIDVANEVDINLTNLKLQKILFFINGMYYASRSDVLFEQEMRAWKYGPIIPEIYYEFKRFGSGSLNQTKSCIFDDPEAQDASVLEISPKHDEYNVIDVACRLLLTKSASDLVNMSHGDDSPWHRFYHNKALGDIIKFETKDKQFFTSIIDDFYNAYAN